MRRRLAAGAARAGRNVTFKHESAAVGLAVTFGPGLRGTCSSVRGKLTELLLFAAANHPERSKIIAACGNTQVVGFAA